MGQDACSQAALGGLGGDNSPDTAAEQPGVPHVSPHEPQRQALLLEVAVRYEEEAPRPPRRGQ